MTDEENPYYLIPGVLPPKRNCQLHYAHIATVFFTLLLIFVVTILTAITVTNVENTLDETKEIIDEMKIIMPQIQEGYKLYKDIIPIACSDKNFTKFYPKYAQLICK
tara:strand:- start:288 stop:608 length:321 start_codon:yes stop_codon:yes gene_type:complete